jgi:hypothetical protein
MPKRSVWGVTFKGEDLSEELHSLKNPVLGAQAPKIKKETGHSQPGKKRTEKSFLFL